MAAFVLDAFAARSCAVKTHNLFDPQVHPATPAVDPSVEESFDDGPSHADRVIAAILGAARVHGLLRVEDHRDLVDQPWQVREDACRTAMLSGVDVIIHGIVPLDLAGHRSGRADLWVRGQDTPDGRPGYHPVEIKAHLLQEQRRSGRDHTFQVPVSPLGRPSPAAAVPVDSRAVRLNSREGDLLQIAHYWRLLESAGFAAGGRPLAGIIGTDQLPGHGLVITWVDLAEPVIRTFSRRSAEGWTRRSILERYDHEHGFRVSIAAVAMQQGLPDAPEPLVLPIVNKECPRCEWWETCRPQLHDHDLSLRIDKSPLDIREISVLRRLGINTIDDLAAVDLDDLMPHYLPEVQHRPGADRRLVLAAHRSRLLADGRSLERITTGPIIVPRADLEIDFDIENSSDDRVYLWGFLVTDTSTGEQHYRHFSSFADLDAAAEARLAVEAMTWLQGLAAGHRTVLVYHYSPYEVNRLGRLAEQTREPVLEQARAWAGDHFVDLFATVREHWFGAHGLGLKVVAHEGAGFTWRDDDPGGLNSQAWFDEAVHSEDPADREASRRRVLEYNEDDVRATAALRDWLSGA
ncbi:RecB family nuclease, putative, TM0106 family [Raineyella antarctica]|uniref:RecB family nuclease, putative, TM0106 family n=1 Tax=Raineyella antarctica TaxID=1577474 RepID=A0A1G6GFC6_9ACTN|nr:TM0106 family RecB-like putative nuclease [Raineyella antarctica]SDB80722.1 RecB family nuclease, putative, TM0106 family [Raineyella antarctica]